jgi:hypothetical protein
VRPLLVPVTVTVYEPAVPEHDNDEVALEIVLLSGRLVGTRLQPRPVSGEIVAERATAPVNPSTPLAITVELPGDPARTVTLAGVVVRAKSWIV